MKILISLLSLFLILNLYSCKENTEETTKKDTKIESAERGIFVKNPWIRPAAGGMNSACFFQLVNNTGITDTVIGAESDLAEVVEVHVSFKDDEGKMGMEHVEILPIEPNSTFVFKPMSYHVMLIGLNEDLVVGDTGKVTIKLKKYGDIIFDAEISDMPISKN